MNYYQLKLNTLNPIIHQEDYFELIKKPNGKSHKLIIGDVQSGKTKFMIDTTKKAIAEKIGVVVIISGTTNLLYDQTLTRFRSAFEFNVYDKKDLKSVTLKKTIDTKIIVAMKEKNSL